MNTAHIFQSVIKIKMISIMLSLLFPASSMGQTQDKPHYYIIQAMGNVSYSIKMNDIPVCRNDNGGSFWGEVNSQLLPGKNEVCVEVTWTPGEDPDQEISLEVKLYLVDMKSKTQNEAKRYATFILPELSDRSKPFVWKQTFTIPFVKDLLLAKAEVPEELTEFDKQEMINQVEALKKSYLTKDVEKIVALQKYQLEDVSRARYKPFDHDGIKSALTEQLSEATFTPVETSDAPKFEQMGRLVRVSYFEDGPDPSAIKIEVEYEGEVDILYTTLYFAKVDGQWIILR